VPAVEVSRLTVRYGSAGPPAVDAIDLRAERSEVLVVLGPNGAGKTSTVEVLEGYRRPAAGSVRVLGLNPIADHGRLTPRIGVMLQRGGVYPMLGPRRVLDLFAAYYDDPVPPEELLHLVGLRGVAGTPWRHLSGGEQQRLSLALALIGRPEVAFLDEPTAGVDPEGRLSIRGVVADLKVRGVCVVLTTHELAEAEAMADRIMILAAGRVALEGTPGELANRATATGAPRLTFGATPGLDTAALAAAVGPGTSVAETAPGRYRVEGANAAGPTGAASVASWLAGMGVTLGHLTVGRTLEDVYFDAVGVAAAQEAAAQEAAAQEAAAHDEESRGSRPGRSQRGGDRSQRSRRASRARRRGP
jgi:ABC-2 type transport system ATP-binding protein